MCVHILVLSLCECANGAEGMLFLGEKELADVHTPASQVYAV